MMNISSAILCISLSVSLFSCVSVEKPVDDSAHEESEIIVIAKWTSPGQTRHRTVVWDEKRGRLETLKTEFTTTIRVLRVIRGNVPLGDTKIITANRLRFQGVGKDGAYRLVEEIDNHGKDKIDKDGFLLVRNREKDVVGDAKNVRNPCIWFLSVGRSWQDGKAYPMLTTPSGIQPLTEETRFTELIRSANAKKR